MVMIPCTQCPSCGLRNQFTVKECECGADLRNCRVTLTEIDRIPQMEFGRIDKNLASYGQICPQCEKVAFAEHPRRKHTTCPACGSGSIASFRPIYYLDLPEQYLQSTRNSLPANLPRKDPGKTAAGTPKAKPRAGSSVTRKTDLPKLPDPPDLPKLPDLPDLSEL